MSFDGKGQVNLKNPEDVTPQAPKYAIPGTPGAASVTTLDASGAVTIGGDVAVNTNKFNVTASNGNTAVAGTLDVTGAADFAGAVDVDGNFSVADSKLTVASASGNTVIAGTLDVAGATDFAAAVDVDGDFSVADNKATIAAASGNTAIAGTLAVTGLATFAAGIQNTPVAVTATVDGLTTGIIPDGASSVAVTSSANTKLVTLPTPTPGTKLKIYNASNGYKLQSSNLTTVKINNVADGAKVLAVTATDLLFAECVSATEWFIWKIDHLGAPATAGVPA